jgi:hypothetical protein
MDGSHLLTYQTQSYTTHVCCQITLLNKFVGQVRPYETKGDMVSHMYFTFLKFAWNSWSCPSSQKNSVHLMIIVFYISYTIMLIFHNRSLNHVEDTSDNSCIFYPCKQNFIHNMWFTSMTKTNYDPLSTQRSGWWTGKAVRHPLSSRWLSTPFMPRKNALPWSNLYMKLK